MPLRIAQLAPPFESVPPATYGGTERVVSTLTEALVERGHDVTLFASGDSRTSARLVPIVPSSLWHVDPPSNDLFHRWRLAHLHEPAIHSGVAMRRAVASRFDLRDVHGAAYLYRYITHHLPHDSRGVALAQYVYSTERRGITDGTFAAVGLGIVAART